MWTASDIRAAIEAEREIVRCPIQCRVLRVASSSDGVVVDVLPLQDRFNRPIDESLEDAKAWWPAEPPVTADICAVDPDKPSILLKRLSGRRPEPDETISIYEPDFYRPLAGLWDDPSLSARALGALSTATSVVKCPAPTLDHKFLRESQRLALGLPSHPTSLLWGPPGTGKTTTLGALVADEVASGRSRRILVTATTHTAVDQAVRAVDEALERTGQEAIRARVKRFGSRVDPKFFVGREHLLPVHDQDAFEKLMRMVDCEPPKANLEVWSEWKQQVDVLRSRLKAAVRDILSQNACVGMTVTSAFFWFEALQEAALDLVIVDEASQLGGPAARMIAVTAKRALFAGDPKQLSAVFRAKNAQARKILGATAFDIVKDAPQVFLEEQSRMVEPISTIVSKVFYGGKLIVAKDKRHDKSWLEERSPYWIEGRQHPQFCIRATDAASTWSQKYKGPIRHGSAEAIVALIDDMLGAYFDPSDIVVLTPFRAQRAVLRVWLGANRTNNIHVSTIHRAQGSERRIVIVDPVDGASDFLSGIEGDRLINVAISRAQAQVVMFLSEADRQNATLRRITVLAGAAGGAKIEKDLIVSNLKDFAVRRDFPGCLRGQVIRVGSTVGEVVNLEKGGDVIVVACRETGNHRKFNTKMAVQLN